MKYIDYVHVCNTLQVSNNKNISKVKKTQDKKLCKLLLRNMGNNYYTCQDPVKLIFNFSSYNLSDREKLLPFHQKLLNIQNFQYPLKCYLEILTAWELLILTKNVLKVDFKIAHTHHLNRFLRFLSKIFRKRRLNHLITQLKIKI